MPTFKVKGTYAVTYFVEVDQLVDGDSDLDAEDEVESSIQFTVNALSLNQTHAVCEWLDGGPEITEVSDD